MGFHSRLKFNHRGVVAMANANKKNDNRSQFFITLGECAWLNRKHTIFGKVTGNTMYNVLKFNDIETDKATDIPLIGQKIYSIEILLNPFDDIELSTIANHKLSKANDAKMEREKEEKAKEKFNAFDATNDAKLLAFGDDEEAENANQDAIDTLNKLNKIKTQKVEKEIVKKK